MSITDELRSVAAKTECANGRCEKLYRGDLERIADLIDSEHERAMSRAGQLLADAEKDRDYNYANWQDCKQNVLQGNITFNELEAEIERLKDELLHCIELPKDADGEPIHVGDVMEWVRYKDDDPTIVRTVSGIGNDVFFAWSDEQGRYAQYEAHAYRHHHAPTVEDVLRDVVTLCHNTWKEGSAFEFYDVDDVMKSGNIAEYAAKLRLAESEDA